MAPEARAKEAKKVAKKLKRIDAMKSSDKELNDDQKALLASEDELRALLARLEAV